MAIFGKYFFIGLGGFFGTIARYYLSQAVKDKILISGLPAGTLTVNLIGCFVIGVLAAFFIQNELHPNYRLFFIVGLLGGFTTFSSFSFETYNLLKIGHIVWAIVYSLASIVSGVALTAVGYITGSFFIGRWF